MRLPIADAVSLEIPPGWEDATLVTLLGPQTPAGRPTLVVGRDARGGATVAAYAADQLARLRGETVGFLAHAAAPAGPDRFVAEHTFTVAARSPVRQLQVFVGRGDDVVTLSITFDAAAFPGARPLIEAIAASFQPTPPSVG